MMVLILTTFITIFSEGIIIINVFIVPLWVGAVMLSFFHTHGIETQAAQVLYSSSCGKAAKDLFLFATFSCRVLTHLGFRSLFKVPKVGDKLCWASSAVSKERKILISGHFQSFPMGFGGCLQNHAPLKVP